MGDNLKLLVPINKNEFMVYRILKLYYNRKFVDFHILFWFNRCISKNKICKIIVFLYLKLFITKKLFLTS